MVVLVIITIFILIIIIFIIGIITYKGAITVYLNEYGKHLPDLVKSKSSYKNYREFMLKLLECRRDEENKPFDSETAQAYADELYQAGGARSLGEFHLILWLFNCCILFDMIWCNMIWYGMIQYDMILYDMILYDGIWYDMI